MPDLTLFRTQVDIFAGVPLEIGSNHTILFDTAAAQKAYFDSHRVTGGMFTNISYQRHASGVMRLEAQMTLLGNASYLRFCNPTFENREFYAFITDIKYINNSTVEINYVIDVLQTWMFEYTVNPCFIDREHAETDNVGDNRVNEGLDTGPFVQAGLEEINHWGTSVSDTSFFVVATQDPQGQNAVNYDYNVYAAFYCHNCATIQDLNTLLQAYMAGPTGSLEPIISISQYPSSFYDTLTTKTKPVTYTLQDDQTVGLGPFVLTDPVGYTIPAGTQTYSEPDFIHPQLLTDAISYGKLFESGVVRIENSDSWVAPAGIPFYSDMALTEQIGTISQETNIHEAAPNVGSFYYGQGSIIFAYVPLSRCRLISLYVNLNDCTPGGMSNYTPKNNKLYTYPYNYMVLESPDGASTTLRYEDFRNHNVHQFWSNLTVFPYAESMCAPLDYETVTNTYNIQHALFSKGYPMVGLATDVYKAWMAQNKYAISLTKALVDTADTVSNAAQEVVAEEKAKERPVASNWFEKALNAVQKGADFVQGGINIAARGIGAAVNNAKEAVADTGLIGTAIQGYSMLRAPETIMSKLLAMYSHEVMPDAVITKANAPSLLTYMGMLNYRIYYMKIRPEYAEMIDNYFSCYGYAVKRVKRPNIKSRTEWNYIKTTGCTISGNVPGDVEAAICAAYDSGLTFWHNPDHMYRYDLDNPINREVTGNG